MSNQVLTRRINLTGGGGSRGLPFAQVVVTPLLNLYPNASVAYSFRKLRSAYAGSAVRLRGADTVEADIGFSGSGDFDTGAAAAFVVAHGASTVVTWYDQSTNGKDVTQATAAVQPAYAASGINGLPSVQFNGTSQYLLSSSFDITALATSPVSSSLLMFQVVRMDSTGLPAQNAFSWQSVESPANRVQLNYDSGNVRLDFPNDNLGGGANGSVRFAMSFFDANHILEGYRDAADLQAVVVDGVLKASTTVTGDLASGSSPQYCGRYAGSANHYAKGYTSEMVTWGTDLGSTNRAAARANINAYYSVY